MCFFGLLFSIYPLTSHETGAALQVINESQETVDEERRHRTKKHSETQIMILVGTQ